MRKNYVAIYENFKLDKYHLNEWSLDLDSQERQRNIVLQMVNKEPSGAYSKFDLWILSNDVQFSNTYFFYSYSYGPSKNSVELVPISKDWDSNGFDCEQNWYAIRAMNTSTEITLLQMLQDTSDSPLFPYLLSNDTPKMDSKLIWKESSLVYLTRMLNVISQEFTLNTQQHQ